MRKKFTQIGARTNMTNIVDGFPYVIWKPDNWQTEEGLGARLLHSGKYNTCVFKAHVWIAFHGLILAIEGPCLGIDHDQRIIDDCNTKYPLRPREWGLGDLAYGGATRYLVGRKESQDAPLTPFDVYWNALIGFYRGRVEIVIAQLKKHAWAQQVFRGSFKSLVIHHNISSIMTALEIRQEILAGRPPFEVVGPWPHNI